MDADIVTAAATASIARSVSDSDVDPDVDTDAVEWLVDNADAYREMLSAIARARRSIWITQLAFDVDCCVYGGRTPSDGVPQNGALLLDALLAAAERGVAVRILLNETLLLDTASPLRTALRTTHQRKRSADVRVRGVRRFPQLLHAKMFIVDEREAMLFGSPFVNGYWDDAAHEPHDSRRAVRELGGRPLHDLSTLIRGPAVRSLGAIFAELWNEVSVGDVTDAPIECRPPRDSNAGGGIRVVRTVARGVLRRHPAGVTEIVTAIEDALAGARGLVYVEHQYLSSRRVVAALCAALVREPGLEVVVVFNQNPDVTAYRGWQNRRLREEGLFAHPRVGLFALWRATPSDDSTGAWTINQLFVHSKVLIVDDCWAMVGSANLDGVSLHSYGDDFTRWIGRRVFRDVRNFDVNAVVGVAGGDRDHAVSDLRTRLWSEHLAMPASELADRPRGGWLALWRRRFAEGLEAISAPASGSRRDSHGPQSIVLPYSTCATPSSQLRDAGVRDLDRLNVCFDPGWLEVHFSPNWVRNMFT
jgi:phosphatidylserine/phosphatidylglycerophosphate/cardiolipin synthase-like enzyme